MTGTSHTGTQGQCTMRHACGFKAHALAASPAAFRKRASLGEAPAGSEHLWRKTAVGSRAGSRDGTLRSLLSAGEGSAR